MEVLTMATDDKGQTAEDVLKTEVGTRLANLLAQATEAVKNAAEKPDGLKDEKIKQLTDAITLARADLDTVQQASSQADDGKTGDAVAAELDKMQSRDVTTGSVTVDDGGEAVYPRLQGALDEVDKLLYPLSPAAALSPIGRRIHLPTNNEAVKRLQVANDISLITMMYLGKTDVRELAHYGSIWTQKATDLSKAMDTVTAGEGLEWVPTAFSSDFVDMVYLSPVVLSQFPRFSMAAATVNVPALQGRLRAYRGTQSTTREDYNVLQTIPSIVTSGKIAFDATKIMIAVGYSDELVEDSIVPIAPLLRNNIVLTMGLDLEDAFINGSTALNDLDNAAAAQLWAATTGTDDVRSAFDGLRKWVETNTATYDGGGTGNIESVDFLHVKTLMGIYGARASDGLIVTGIDGETIMLGLDDVRTIDKFGPKATVHTGQIGALYGWPILVSENIYGPGQGTGLNTDGVYDGVTTTSTVALMVHKNSFWIGDRRTMTVESDRSVLAQQNWLVTSTRLDIQKMYPESHVTAAALVNMIL